VHTSTDNSEHKNLPRLEDISTPAGQNNDLPAVEDDLEFESLEPLAILKRNELSSSMCLQRPNRVSIMFDTNMKKSARLSMRDNIQWEIIEKDEMRLDTVSPFEMKA